MLWLRFSISETDYDYAGRRIAETAALSKFFDTQNAWVGYVGESVVARWLTSFGVEFVHNGGADRKPDFEILPRSKRVGVELKTRDRDPLSDLWCVVPEQHVAKRPAFWLFAALHARQVFVLGAIAGVEFAETSERMARLHNPLRFVRPEDLQRPDEWLASLT